MSLATFTVPDTRTRILEATAACISQDGLVAVRMVTIAKAAGVSTALLHYHFATKEHLLEQVLRHSYESTTVLDQAALSDAGRTAAQRLAAYLDRYLPSDDSLARDWLLWQEFGLMSLRHPRLAAVNADLHEGDVNAIAGIINDGIADGSFHDCDAAAIACAAVAMCDGLGTRVLSDDPRTTLHDAREIVATTIASLIGYASRLPFPTEGTSSTSQPSRSMSALRKSRDIRSTRKDTP